ncbi:MAG: 5-(carboxyamino)imidazole ribonucleotide mutase [Chloroflexota bacterium]
MVTVRNQPLIGIVMGSRSDWETVQHAAATLDALAIPFEARIVSAHRTPDLLFEYAGSAQGRGLQLLIAAAGGAAHLPGMMAAKTTLPVVGIPIESHALHGIDSLLSIVQMPAGVPVASMAIGRAGAVNAALFAASVLAPWHPLIQARLVRFREEQSDAAIAEPLPGFSHDGTRRDHDVSS